MTSVGQPVPSLCLEIALCQILAFSPEKIGKPNEPTVKKIGYFRSSWLKWPWKKVRPVFKAKSGLDVDSASVYKNEVTQAEKERSFSYPLLGPAPTAQFGIFSLLL